MEDIDIRRWVSLCQCARKLPARQWETWTFIVGTGGSLPDRIRLGAAALSTFGRHWSYHPNAGGEVSHDDA